jgi:CheY-like chemotaxis protein
MRFFHSAALRKRTEKLLTAIEGDTDPTPHADALADLVVDLTEAGMDDYFLKPLRQAKLGMLAQKTASLTTAGALRVMAPMVRRILRGADGAQLRVIAEHMRHASA